jgi:hypothetical protein
MPWQLFILREIQKVTTTKNLAFIHAIALYLDKAIFEKKA